MTHHQNTTGLILCGSCGVLTHPEDMNEVPYNLNGVCNECEGLWAPCENCTDHVDLRNDPATDQEGGYLCKVCRDAPRDDSAEELTIWHHGRVL